MPSQGCARETRPVLPCQHSSHQGKGVPSQPLEVSTCNFSTAGAASFSRHVATNQRSKVEQWKRPVYRCLWPDIWALVSRLQGLVVRMGSCRAASVPFSVANSSTYDHSEPPSRR